MRLAQSQGAITVQLKNNLDSNEKNRRDERILAGLGQGRVVHGATGA